VRELAELQDGVVSRRQVYAAGLTRWQVQANLRGDRWQRVADQSLCLHTGPLTDRAQRWAAVFQGGPRAQLDGAASLVESGLERFAIDRIRVSVPRGAKARRTPSYDIRQTRRWSADDLAPTGLPRTRPDVAAVRAGLWARSDKQATLVVTMAVQQGIVRPEDLGRQLLRIRRDRRRALLHAVVNDLLDGARSLGELDVVAELRRRGLPAPARQVLRRDARNRYYLDLSWPAWKLVVEVDGIHHAWAENVVGDALRQNALALEGDTVLRLPLLGLRLEPAAFYEQIGRALRAAGWSPDVITNVA
jgi:very-short-patch-repair endonuclease